jgi:hypothetical protein
VLEDFKEIGIICKSRRFVRRKTSEHGDHPPGENPIAVNNNNNNDK